MICLSPVCMGIINATPDSFSDGAELQRSGAASFQLDIDKALFRAETMVAEGATFVDVGGESTRPGAATVSEQEELDRVIPLIAAISASLDVCVSIDTSSPVVMKEALDSGAQLINDIRALAIPGAAELLGSTKAAVCLMHMQGAPSTMQKTPSYGSVVLEVFDFLKSRVAYSLECGIERGPSVDRPRLRLRQDCATQLSAIKKPWVFFSAGDTSASGPVA